MFVEIPRLNWIPLERESYDHPTSLTLRRSSPIRKRWEGCTTVAIRMHRRGWSPPVMRLECMCRCYDVRRIRAPREERTFAPGGEMEATVFLSPDPHIRIYIWLHHIFTIHVYDYNSYIRRAFTGHLCTGWSPLWYPSFAVFVPNGVIGPTAVSRVFFVPLLRIIAERRISIRRYTFSIPK